MTQRIDSIYGHAEAFAYDSMNRLTAGGSDAYAYDTKGNITYRDGVGSYGYTLARSYAVNHVPFSTMIPQREQHIAFNALQMPDSISEGGAIATFSYGADLQRSTMSLSKDGATTTTRYYDGSLNTFTRTSGTGTAEKQVLYIGGDAYSAPAAFVRDFGSADWQLRHIVRDNQGSIVAIADTAGNVLERNDYDPWGVLRNPLTQAPYDPADQPSLMLGRGYCGHEHLSEFGLINMNARLYDPALCRFLSPDPIVQAPTDPQNFNRYTYSLNNPLRYTDPSGMAWMVSIYNGHWFLFYDSEINTQDDIVAKYGDNTNLKIFNLNNGHRDIYITVEDKIKHTFRLFDDGTFSSDGEIQSDEVDEKDLLYISNDRITDMAYVNSNWYGSYLGPKNPSKDNNDYSYAFPPLNNIDYAAFIHDKDYDRLGVAGLMGVFCTSKTNEADLRLADNAFKVMKNNNFNLLRTDVRWALAVYSSFGILGEIKSLIEWIKQ